MVYFASHVRKPEPWLVYGSPISRPALQRCSTGCSRILASSRIRSLTLKPRGHALTLAQTVAKRHIARRRVRIEHVNSRVKRCRIVYDMLHLRRKHMRDFLMEAYDALHNFRVR